MSKIFNSKAKKNELRQALMSKNPYQLASVLDVPVAANGRNNNNNGGGNDVNTWKNETLHIDDVDWSSVLTSWLDATYYSTIYNNDSTKCYESHATLHSSFNHIFGSSSGNWLVPALHKICHNTHKIAVNADDNMSSSSSNSNNGNNNNKESNNSNKNLLNAVTLLQESYSKTFNDRTEYNPNEEYNDTSGSKKAGVLYIVNELFAMYFRLNTLRLCKNLLKPVETRKLHINSSSMGDMVTYRYYVGRLQMFEDQYDTAESNLDYALMHCHKDSINNKKRILKFLIPVKLLRGRLPTSYLLQKYNLIEFIPLVNGLKTGNLQLYQDGLNKYQDLFIRRGIYLLLEKIKTVCYRNLFKRIYIIMDKKSQLSLETISRTFKFLNIREVDLDEIECILANLIYRNYIRGYISHAKRVLVLSKRDPFPTSTVIVK